MLSIEEYIACRKQEDNIKEFDLNTRAKNTKICVDYVFEYFNDYLLQHEKTAKKYMYTDKKEKYKSRIQNYNPEVQKWLIDLYSKHYNLLNFTIGHIIDKDDYFLLSYSEEDFRNIANECYSKLTRKYAYLRDEKEGIFLFAKDYHRIESLGYRDENMPKLPQPIAEWLNNTWLNYHVDLTAFAYEWCFSKLRNHTIIKPLDPRDIISYPDFKLDLSQKENLFNINNLYNDISNKPFITNRKQELLTLIVYYWSTFFKDTSIWEICLDVLWPSLK